MTRYFTQEHEWIEIDGENGTVGVTEYAQNQLGDVVYVELPEIGKELAQGREAAVIESVKAASDVFSPVDGTVTDINTPLADEPAKINADPEKTAWFFKMRVADRAQLDKLMDEAAYKSFVQDLH